MFIGNSINFSIIILKCIAKVHLLNIAKVHLLAVFPVFVSITQFYDFLVISYGN